MNKTTRIKLEHDTVKYHDEKWFYEVVIDDGVHTGLALSFFEACEKVNELIGEDITLTGLLVDRRPKEKLDEVDDTISR